jgi:hypothetical protein
VVAVSLGKHGTLFVRDRFGEMHEVSVQDTMGSLTVSFKERKGRRMPQNNYDFMTKAGVEKAACLYVQWSSSPSGPWEKARNVEHLTNKNLRLVCKKFADFKPVAYRKKPVMAQTEGAGQ